MFQYPIIVLGDRTSPNQNAAITPDIPVGQVRVILTWGQSPADLDAHLTGPLAAGSGRFHVFWANMRYDHNGTTHAALDRDDVSSYGPETMTIYQQAAGEYVFSVHDYTNRSSTNSRALGNSSAKVTVQRGGSSEIHTYHVPAGVGTLWRVFKIESPGARPVPINTLANHTDPSTVQVGPREGADGLRAAPAKP